MEKKKLEINAAKFNLQNIPNLIGLVIGVSYRNHFGVIFSNSIDDEEEKLCLKTPKNFFSHLCAGHLILQKTNLLNSKKIRISSNLYHILNNKLTIST